MTYSDLGKQVKLKNPSLSGTDDEIGRNFVATHPEFESLVSSEIPRPTTTATSIDATRTQPLPETEESEYEPISPYNAEEGFSWGGMAQNALGDLGENVFLGSLRGATEVPGMIGSAASGVGNFATGMADAAQGEAVDPAEQSAIQGGANIIEFLRGGVMTPPSNPIRQGVTQIAGMMGENLTSPEQWQERPLSNATELWGLLAPIGQATLPSKAAQYLQQMNMYNVANKVSQRIFGGSAKLAENIYSEIEGVATGKGGDVFREALESTSDLGSTPSAKRMKGIPLPWVDTGPRGKAYYANLRREEPITAIGEAVTEGLYQARQQRGIDYVEQLPNLRSIRIDGPAGTYSDATEELKKVLREWGVQGIPEDVGMAMGRSTPIDADALTFNATQITSKAAQNKIKDIVREWSNLPKEAGGIDKIDIAMLDNAKKRTWDHRARIPHDYKSGRSLSKGLFDVIDNKLKKEVEGYQKLTSDYRKISDLIDEFEETFSIPAEGAKRKSLGPALKSLSGMLKGNTSAEVKETVFKALSDAMGIPDDAVMSAVAGRALSEMVSSGLIGKSLFAGGSVGSGASIFTGNWSGLPVWVASLMFVIPKSAGEIAGKLGATKRQIKFGKKIFDEVTEKLPPGIYAEGMTLFEVLDRYERDMMMPRAVDRITGNE